MKEVVMVILVVCTCLFIGGLWGWHFGVADLGQEAIDHGAAKWTIDAKTGERKFEWLGKE